MHVCEYLREFQGEGTKGDQYTKAIIKKILTEGCFDKNPRPKYHDKYENAIYDEGSRVIITCDDKVINLEDNQQVFVKDGYIEVHTPAHTISVNEGVECTYDLSKGESPLITLRPIATRTSIAEILWIWQKASNDLVLFDELIGKNTWDIDKKIHNWWNDWAIRDKNGEYVLNELGHPHIGNVYGETNRSHEIFKKEVLDSIINDPDGRRKIATLWQYEDFTKSHGLKPCVFENIWNVRHGRDGIDYLDMTVIQRSSDFATAGCINQVQYAALLIMVAKHVGMVPGYFTWKPINVQLYDRHIENAKTMLNREAVCGDEDIKMYVSEDKKDFYDILVDDVVIEKPEALIKKKNPKLDFDLGI